MDKRLFRILLILSLVSITAGLIVFPHLPDTVPIQWDSSGHIDNYGSKYIALLLLAVPLLTTIGLWVMPRLDPKSHARRQSPRTINFISAATVIPLIALGWITLLPALGLQLPVPRLIMGAVGVMFIVMGNFMPQLQPNFFIGIRTPWTLYSETTWRRTHRLGGILFCVDGVLLVLWQFLPQWLPQSLPVLLLLPAISGVYIYSYAIYKRLSRRGADLGCTD